MAEIVRDYSQLNFDRPGRATFEVAFHHDGRWGYAILPMTVLNGQAGPGKTVVCFGGTHGDEYEGQVAVWRLMHDLDPAQLSGRVILLPRLNTPACMAVTRESPFDGLDLNKVFPGDPAGSVTRRIAHFVASQIFPRADVVIDLHSAGTASGKGSQFVMCASFHRLADPRQFAETRQVAALFDTPFIMIYSTGLARGLLTEEAENLGKITIGTELGHSVGVSQRGVAHAYTGVMNVLRHYGLLPGELEAVDPARGTPPQLVSATDLDCYIPAPIAGVYEPVVGLGSQVAAGDLVGRLYRFEEVDREPVPVYAPRPGILIMHSFRAPTQKGDTMLVFAEAVDE